MLEFFRFIFWVFIVGPIGLLFIFSTGLFDILTLGRGARVTEPIYKKFGLSNQL